MKKSLLYISVFLIATSFCNGASSQPLLFTSTVWGVGAPTNPAPFSALSVGASSTSQVVLGVNALTNIAVSFEYTATSQGAVTYSLDLSKTKIITPQILEAGLFVRIDLVPSATSASFPLAQVIQHSYFWGGPGQANTMFVSLVDAQGTVYAGGGCTGAFASQYTPTSYTVTINSGTAAQMSTTALAVNGTSTPVVAFKSGVSSTQGYVTYPLMKSTVWGVGAPTNPTAFSQASINSGSANKIVVGIAELQNINLSFNYTSTSDGAVTFDVDLTQFNNITSQILAAGLFIKIDLVPSSSSASYPNVEFFPHSYFWGGPGQANTMFVSLVDSQGVIYAGGACTGDFASQYVPTSYTAIINSGTNMQMETVEIPFGSTVVNIQSGVTSTSGQVTYPLFNSTVWGVPVPSNPAAFSAVSIASVANKNIVVGVSELNSVNVALNYGTTNGAVTFDIDLTKYNTVTSQALASGLVLKLDFVPSASSATYPNVSLFPRSYFWGGPGQANTVFASLVDAQGTIYAAGACTGNFASQYTPTSYTVTVNSGDSGQTSTLPIVITATGTQAVMFQSGVTSTVGKVTYPLMYADIYQATVTSATFAAMSIDASTQQGNAVVSLNSDVKTVGINLNYGPGAMNAVQFNIDLTGYAPIPASILAAGLYVDIDFVAAANVAKYPLAQFIQGYWNYPTPGAAANTVFVSLVDAQGNVYAAGASNTFMTSTNIPASYSVVVNNGLADQVASSVISVASGSATQGVVLQTGVAAPQGALTKRIDQLIHIVEIHKNINLGAAASTVNNPTPSVSAVTTPSVATDPVEQLIKIIEVHKNIAVPSSTKVQPSAIASANLPAVSTLKPFIQVPINEQLLAFTYSPIVTTPAGANRQFTGYGVTSNNLAIMSKVLAQQVPVIVQIVTNVVSGNYEFVVSGYNGTTQEALFTQSFASTYDASTLIVTGYSNVVWQRSLDKQSTVSGVGNNKVISLLLQPVAAVALSDEQTLLQSLLQSNVTPSTAVAKLAAGTQITSWDFIAQNAANTNISVAYAFIANGWNQSTTVGVNGIAADTSAIFNALTAAQWQAGINVMVLGLNASGEIITDLTTQMPVNYAIYMFDANGKSLSNTPIQFSAQNIGVGSLPQSFGSGSVTVQHGMSGLGTAVSGAYPLMMTIQS